MSQNLKSILATWLEDQSDFGPLGYLPAGLSVDDLLDPARLKAAKAAASASRAVAAVEKPKEEVLAPEEKVSTVVPTVTPKEEVLAPEEKVSAVVPSESQETLMPQGLNEIAECKLCSLKASRSQVMVGQGSEKADLIVIADAPSAEDDAENTAFAGQAGDLLDKMLAAIDLSRDDLFITYAVKCHPPEGRHAGAAEYGVCRHWLRAQIRQLKPTLLLALGKTAGNLLLGQNRSLTDMRREEHQAFGLPLIVSYHPAALLRNAHWKRPAWEDLQALKVKLDSLKATYE
jgi:uracil-DNA glycosylase